MACEILLNVLLSALLPSVGYWGQDVETALKNVEEFPETHGLLFEFLLNLGLYSFVVFCG